MSGAGRLEGRVCVVTGASGGIGAATVELYQREGAKVVGVDLLEGAPGDLALQVDVTSEEDVAGAFARVREEFGRIDVLFNNAGISPNDDGSVIETTLEAWERVQNVNLRSVFLCCKHGIPHLLENDGPLRGSVINTASFVAVMGAATSQISYTASKGGVLALSRELGVEFARRGVRVNALCPGPVDTPLLKELFAKDPEKAARRLVHVPMGRFARAEEIAQGALFLASDESSFVTATHLPCRRRPQRRLHDPAGLDARSARPRRLPRRRPRRGRRGVQGDVRPAEFARTIDLPQFSIVGVYLGAGTGSVEVFTITDPALLEQRLGGRRILLDHVAHEVDDIAPWPPPSRARECASPARTAARRSASRSTSAACCTCGRCPETACGQSIQILQR